MASLLMSLRRRSSAVVDILMEVCVNKFSINVISSFITKDGYGITKKGIAYFKPLISGKLEHKFSSMPKYKKGKLKLVKKKLPLWV